MHPSQEWLCLCVTSAPLCLNVVSLPFFIPKIVLKSSCIFLRTERLGLFLMAHSESIWSSMLSPIGSTDLESLLDRNIKENCYRFQRIGNNMIHQTKVTAENGFHQHVLLSAKKFSETMVLLKDYVAYNIPNKDANDDECGFSSCLKYRKKQN